MKILVVGVATVDIVNHVEAYPSEDSKIRVIDQQRRVGGNAANTARVLAQLGHPSCWAGALGGDAEAHYIRTDLERVGVDCQYAAKDSSGASPVSCITLNQANGSRTILHHRKLREFGAADFAAIDASIFSWTHFEGRNIPELYRIFTTMSQPNFSLEVEKARDGIETLLQFPSLVLFAKDYVVARGYKRAPEFLAAVKLHCRKGAWLVCAWGDQGAWAIDDHGELLHEPAHSPKVVVDTLGAGDVFNAAMISGFVEGQSAEVVLKRACLLAGRKCAKYGFSNLTG